MIHTYRMNGYNIAMDINSGAIHVLDDLSYAILEKIKTDEKMDENASEHLLETMMKSCYKTTEIKEAYSELYELYKNEELFSSDEYLSKALINADKYQASAPVKAMCLHIAHDCNMRCEYCFAGAGDYVCGRELMPLEVAKDAIDFLMISSKGRKNLEIDFFGGEPLMGFETVKKTVEYGRIKEKEYGKNIRFTLTTNGLLLNDEISEFINKEISNVVLSADGRKEINDKVRKRVDGTGCYDSVMPKFKKLTDERQQDKYYIRGTFTRYNLDFIKDVIHLADCGFKQISIEPVTAEDKVPYSIRQEDLPIVFEEYEKLAKEMLSRRINKTGENFNFFHFMIDFEQGPCAIKRVRGCGCGNEYVAVTPNGDVYPCHQFVGTEQFKMGNVKDKTLDVALKTEFAGCNIYKKPSCKDCFAKFYCSGGCNAANFNYCGDIYKSYRIGCELERKRVECAVMMKIAEMEAEEEQQC